MAQSREAGNPTVTAENPLTDLLAAPLSPDWTHRGTGGATALHDRIAAEGGSEGAPSRREPPPQIDNLSVFSGRCLPASQPSQRPKREPLPTFTEASSASRETALTGRFGFWASSRTSPAACVSRSSERPLPRRSASRKELTYQPFLPRIQRSFLTRILSRPRNQESDEDPKPPNRKANRAKL